MNCVSLCHRMLTNNAHELEAAETGDQRSPSLLDDLNEAANVGLPTGERCSDTSLGLGKTQSNVSGFQSATVVCAVSAESDRVAESLQTFDELVLLVGRHASKNDALDEHLQSEAVSAERRAVL